VAGVEVGGVDPNVGQLVTLTMASQLDSVSMAALLYVLETDGDIPTSQISSYWVSRQAPTLKILSATDFPEAAPPSGGACQTFPTGQGQGTWCPW
jgi:hypothetical protein